MNREFHCAIFRACYLEFRTGANDRAGKMRHQARHHIVAPTH